MAKKSTVTRQTNAARRPQTSAKAPAVKLVRPGGGTATVSAGTQVLTRPTQSAPARPTPVAKATLTPKAAPRPTPKGVAAAARPAAPALAAPSMNAAGRAQLQRAEAAKVARAREMQRARAANLITPEHYAYVKNDLRLIGALASVMFAIVIALHFVLG